MRSATWTRWAACAVALSICVPVALADRGTKSISTCTSFAQEDKGDDKVEFKIHNTCTIPVDCTISWRVVCAPESKKRRADRRQVSSKLSASAFSRSRWSWGPAFYCWCH